jgi:hypothetical protein
VREALLQRLAVAAHVLLPPLRRLY